MTSKGNLKQPSADLSGLPYQETLHILQRYCSYQDRCRQDISKKFNDLGLPETHLTRVIHELTEESFLNEERYARMFVRGHFRKNKWGRLKIRQALQQKGIPSEIINDALQEIDEQYDDTLLQLLEKKKSAIKNNGDRSAVMNKLLRIGIQKGYESSMVYACLKKIMKT